MHKNFKMKWLIACLTALLILSFFRLVEVHAQTESITYSGGVITVTGFTEESPCTFWDVWNASNVNGWGVVYNNEESNVQYQLNCTLEIGDDSTETWFHDRSVQVLWFSDSVVYDALLVYSNAHFILGDVLSESNKATQNSSSIMTHNFWNIYCDGGEMSFYDVTIHCLDPAPDWVWIGYESSSVQSRIWNCRFNKGYDVSFYSSSNVSLSNVEIIDSEDVHEIWESIDLENVVFRNSNHQLFYFDFSGNITIKNLVASNATEETFYIKTNPENIYLVNPTIDAWTFEFHASSNAKLYRQYTFDLTTTANSTVEITYYGQGGSTIFNETDADGIIPTQTISKEFYNQTGGNTPYSYEPLHLKISKDGYQTYEANFTLSDKTSWEISLQSSSANAGWTLSLFGVILIAVCVPGLLVIIMVKKH